MKERVDARIVKLNTELKLITECISHETQIELKESMARPNVLEYENEMWKNEVVNQLDTISNLEKQIASLRSEKIEIEQGASDEMTKRVDSTLILEKQIARLRSEKAKIEQDANDAVVKNCDIFSNINKQMATLRSDKTKLEQEANDKINNHLGRVLDLEKQIASFRSDSSNTEQAFRRMRQTIEQILTEIVNKLNHVHQLTQESFGQSSELHQSGATSLEEAGTLIKCLFSERTQTISEKNVNNLQQMILATIAEIQRKFDQEHQIRETAETNVVKTEKAKEALSINVEELKKQLKPEKDNLEAMEKQYTHIPSNTNQTNDDVITEMTVDPGSMEQAHVYLKGDKEFPVITGCKFLPDGKLILCDKANKKLKLFSNSFTVDDTLDVQAEPWDVAVLNSKTVIVTLPYEQLLQYVQLVPHLELKGTIQVHAMCWGVEVFSEKIYTSCHDDLEDGEVKVFDIKGNFKMKFDMHTEQLPSLTIKQPDYITVSSTSGNVYLTDNITGTITCWAADGNNLYIYKDPDLKRPAGIFVDSEDNIIVCGEGSQNLQVITASGNKQRTLMSSVDGNGNGNPMGVAYRASDHTLVVGFRDGNVSILRLTH